MSKPAGIYRSPMLGLVTYDERTNRVGVGTPFRREILDRLLDRSFVEIALILLSLYVLAAGPATVSCYRDAAPGHMKSCTVNRTLARIGL